MHAKGALWNHCSFGITETTSIAFLQKLPCLDGKHERGSDTEIETVIRFDDWLDTSNEHHVLHIVVGTHCIQEITFIAAPRLCAKMEDKSRLATHSLRLFLRVLPREELDEEVFHAKSKRIDFFPRTRRIHHHDFKSAEELLKLVSAEWSRTSFNLTSVMTLYISIWAMFLLVVNHIMQSTSFFLRTYLPVHDIAP
jgi:hypothetical protein